MRPYQKHSGRSSHTTSLWGVRYWYKCLPSSQNGLTVIHHSWPQLRETVWQAQLTLGFSMKIHMWQYCWPECYKLEVLPREPGSIPTCNTRHQWLWSHSRVMKETSGKQSRGVHTHRCRSCVCFRFSSSSLQHLVTALQSVCAPTFFPLFVGVHMSMVLVHVCVSVFCTFMCVRVHEGCKPEAEVRCLPISLSILQLVFEAVSVTGPGAEWAISLR